VDFLLSGRSPGHPKRRHQVGVLRHLPDDLNISLHQRYPASNLDMPRHPAELEPATTGQLEGNS
jgi:hypothetical protein